MKTNDGGSAFAIPFSDQPGAYDADPGMSLRDYFAAKAMAGILASNAYVSSDTTNPTELIAFSAYKMADAMLEERGRDE